MGTPIDEALAGFCPRNDRRIPDFKFANRQNKTVICKRANLGVHKKNHYLAYALFLKMAKRESGLWDVFSNVVRITLFLKNQHLVEVAGTRPLDQDEIDAVYVESKDSHLFAGVKTLNSEQFAARAQQGGGAFVTMHA